MIMTESAGLTDTGRRRSANEDSFCMDDNIGFYVVADGMGGHAAGEVASRLAVDTLHDYMVRSEADMAAKTTQTCADRLSEAIRLANKSIYDVAQGNRAYSGMGTTIAAVLFYDSGFISANVGDSPVFMVRDDEIRLISTPHTVETELADRQSGKMPLGDEFKHMLTRAVGTKPEVEPYITETQCLPGDTIIISSDGLTDMLTTKEIGEITAANRPAAACRLLTDLANERGGEDNITVIVLKVKKIYKNPLVTGFLRLTSNYLAPKPVIRQP
ncbi:MAG: hypothetical protein B5M56_00190 [Desulfococcus sp. 4484_241]|nr:MAG: hypothetical protein B5M56_00190 [Desulfococcus sp. 4484_241]